MTKLTLKDLSLSELNRTINRKHVDRLKEMIRKNGYYASMPIIATKDGKIIDGQHRFLACKELKIEPPIMIEDNIDLMLTINTTQLKWSFQDFVNYYAAKGLPDYIELKRICKLKGISPKMVYNIVFKKGVYRKDMPNGSQQNPIKTGTFKFPDLSEKGISKVERSIDRVLHLISVLNLQRTERLITAITRLAENPNFVFDTMEKKIELQRARIYRCSTIEEYAHMLANLYNYKNGKKVVV